MLGRLILRLRRLRDMVTLGAGELAIVLTPSAMVSYAGGGSE